MRSSSVIERKKPIEAYPRYPVEANDEYWIEMQKLMSQKIGDVVKGPTKKERALAAKYGFTLPPLGGEPESVILWMVELHKKNMGAIAENAKQSLGSFDYNKILEGAYEIVARWKKREDILALVKYGNTFE